MGQRLQKKLVLDVSRFRGFGAQKFSARRHIIKQRTHFDLRPRRFAAVAHRLDPSAVYQKCPCRRPHRARECSAGGVKRWRCSAALRPENQSVLMAARSAAEAILLVACRSRESRASSDPFRSRHRPPECATFRHAESRPRSRGTSINTILDQFLHDRAGRSTTSPAATWLARVSGRSLILLIGLLTLDPFDSLRSLRTSFRFLIATNFVSQAIRDTFRPDKQGSCSLT